MSISRELVEQTERYVHSKLQGDNTGHDWWHVDRVRRLALHIGRQENADLLVVELAALLHDIADWKFHDGDDSAGPLAAQRWLESLAADAPLVDRVTRIVGEVSFKGAGVPTCPTSLEGQVVQDADRLDAIGAIGIARTFAYGAHAGQPIHDPDTAPELHETFAAYQRGGRSTINHFYEKLLLLADRMHTPAARAIAARRHRFLEEFLNRFHEEWNGLDAEVEMAQSAAGIRNDRK
jgi:uncharacterized protein